MAGLGLLGMFYGAAIGISSTTNNPVEPTLIGIALGGATGVGTAAALHLLFTRPVRFAAAAVGGVAAYALLKPGKSQL